MTTAYITVPFALQGQGIGNLGTMVPAQDYSKIRRQCIQSKRLFEDPYFPADDRSLFFSTKLPFTPEWKRPHVSRVAGSLYAKCNCNGNVQAVIATVYHM